MAIFIKFKIKAPKIIPIIPAINVRNIDSKIISSILMRDLVRAKQITTMTITMPDKPGQLNIISNICANSGANVLRVEHNRFTMDLSASLAKLDITIETQNEDHLTKIINLMILMI